ncbi:MAG TPA: ferredoxin--NAD(+) reductase [Eubacteriaceae bacterium]|nr:ferredoxin--NAD(+) reductase [Eubacteriaceae bacterium]
MNNYYIKTERTFTPTRKYAWIFTVLVAIGGLWEPRLGLLVILIMAGLIGTSFFSGRYWCGNFCPHGSLFDQIIMPISLNKKIPKFLKSKWMIGGFFLFFMFSFSRKIYSVIPLWGEMVFVERLGFVFVTTYLMVLLVGGLFALTVNPRTWCQFCPMGTLQKLSYALGRKTGVAKKTEPKVTISSQEKCHSCGKCSRVCPFQLKPYLEFSDNNQFDNINCIKCGTCVENCPAGILSLETEKEAIQLKEATSIAGYENRQKITAKLSNIINLKDDTKEYVFDFQSPQKVSYEAGQFILVKIEDEPLSYRAYSISSYNEDDSSLSIIVKRVENGYGTSILFDRFNIGDPVELEGPMGDELLIDRSGENLIFIANGIGITPFIAMVKDALLNQPHLKRVTLLHGQRFDHDFLYSDYFKELEKEYPKFTYEEIASRPKSQQYRKGYVTELIKEVELKDAHVYMCGSKNMIVDSYNYLKENGVKKENINYESEEKIKEVEEDKFKDKKSKAA